MVLLSIGGLALGLYRVEQQHQIIRLGYELNEARTTLRHLQEEENRLRLEESVLTNPGRIENLAGSLGMVRPGPDQLRVVKQRASVAVNAQH
jgi:cell division protein FtsL